MNVFNKLSFRIKLLLTVGFACAVCGLVSVGVALYHNNKEINHGIVSKSRIIHGRLDVAAKYVSEQGGLKPMIESYTKKYKDSSELTEEDKSVILQQVPIYAAMKIGADGAEKDQYNFRVFSDEARNKKNAATKEEMEIFNKFQRDPNLKELVSENSTNVTVYRPVRLSESRGCLTCHGNPTTSPWGNGKDILGYKMEDWKDGKLHGVFAVSFNIPAVLEARAQLGETSSTLMLSVFITIGALAALIIAAFIINPPIKALSAVASALSQSGEQVTSASTQIASSSQELSQAATEQASSLEKTAASLEEITAMVAKASDSAESTAISSSESHKKAEEGRSAVDQMLTSMDEIRQSNEAILTQINESNRQMTEIVSVIQEIGSKTKVINEIVFQTKLLSFNASVEAARAGEHGKGFAVVAEEVGNLAQMSGNAAKEITEMLDGSVSKVESIVKETKSKVETLIQLGKEKIDTGVIVAKQCSDVLNEIVHNVSCASRFSQEISQANKEQAQGVAEINKAVSQLDAVTQQNATTSEEAANAAEVLATQAESLRALVDNLVDVIDGNNSAKITLGAASQFQKKTNALPLKAVKKFPDGSSEQPVDTSLKIAPGHGLHIPEPDDDGFKDV